MKLKDHISVVIAVVIQSALGMVWYSPGVMGERWSAAQGKSMADLVAPQATTHIALLLASFFFCYFLKWLILRLNITQWAQGARLGTYVSLCFGASAVVSHLSPLGYSLDLIWIDCGYTIVAGFLSGIVLSKR